MVWWKELEGEYGVSYSLFMKSNSFFEDYFSRYTLLFDNKYEDRDCRGKAERRSEQFRSNTEGGDMRTGRERIRYRRRK